MDTRTAGIALVTMAVFALTGAQVLIKARLTVHGGVPFNWSEVIPFLLGIAADWKMWLGLLGLIVSSFLWYAAISHLPLSLAYPFAALSYPLIFAASVIILRETFSWQILAGNVLVVSGVVLVALASR